jgi:hypothetical protein
MLYWICPECGHECSPAIRECPTCIAVEKPVPASPVPASKDIQSLAQTIQSAPAAGPPPAQLLSAGPSRNPFRAANGYSAPAGAAVITLAVAEEVVAEAVVAEAVVAPEAPPPPLAPLEDLAVKPSRPTSLEPAKPAVSPAPARVNAPALVAAKSPRAEFRLRPAGLAPIGDIAFQAAPLDLPKAHQQSAEPAPSRRRSVAFVRAALQCVNTNELAVADFTPPDEMQLTPPEGGNEAANTTNVAPLHPKAGCVAFISSKLDLAAESLSDLLHALEASTEELERASIHAIHAAFQEQPTELLLCAPREIVTAPAPPAEQWMRSPRIVFTAKAPRNAGLATLTAGPQPPTIAGPCLPPQLRNFMEGHSSNPRLRRKRAAAPTWMVSVLVATVLFLGAASLLQYLTANRDAKAASVAPTPTQTSVPAPAPPIRVAIEHPGARFVEVAGVRVVTAPSRKPQLQYLVINHSAGELTGLNIHIAVHSADAPAGAPLFSVSGIVPSLAANQSKEIRTDLDTGLSAASIPDWQSLRTEILITRQ